MQKDLKERCLNIGWYMYENQSTVRQAAIVFGVSKSTVYVDLTQRLPMFSPVLANKVRKVLEQNKNERHIRGGLATKNKYCVRKQSSNF